ncbi:ABC transporter ATP-binding protein [Candidatus Woesearchaeota archaeon]|jgi:ATP-binding cassette, subfamily B, heavy metal transporter|nr:ABC transporter ATP-binding protein [Candidatus Woesearchaeota archaeon]
MARGYDLKKYEVNTKYNLKTLWSYLRKYKLLAIIIILIALALELTSFFDNFVFKFLIDKAADYSQGLVDIDGFISFLLMILALFVFVRGFIGAGLWYLRIKLFNRLEGKLMNDIERSSFWHVLNLSYRYHLNKKTGSMISQFTRGVGKIEGLLDSIMFNFIGVFFRIVLSLGIIVFFDFKTALVMLIMIIAFITSGIIITNKQKKPQNEANYREDILKQNISDVYMNIETVKYFGKEKKTQSYFASLSNYLKDARIKFWDIFSYYIGIQNIIITLGTAFMFYFSFTGFVNGELTLGTITLIFSAVWKLVPQLFNFLHGYRHFIRCNVDVSALFETFKEKNEVVDVPNAKKLKVKDGKINFKNVYFTYPVNEQLSKKNQRKVIKDFNLKINKNQKIALVGPSGGGKTTVIKLLYRLFDIDQGQILIDGQDVSKVTQESLHNNMSVVPQEPLLFDNTLWFNIAYANPLASKRAVWKAIKFAQLDKFIANLPKKEKTIVGERGVKLSGGEKQRVSIARALLANKQILILDEATSALDSETEREIQNDLEKLMQGRTTIMIAHRLSTIMKADKIIVLGNGKIVEIGNHKELTNKRGGLYRRLWDLQMGGEL